MSPVPNPTDTARALVEQLEHTVMELQAAQSITVARIRKDARDAARTALLAHVDTLRIERDGFKELYEEWLTWAKGAVEKCKPEIPPSDSPQAQGIIDERLAHVAGVERERDALVRAIDEEMTSAHIGVFNAGDDVKKALAMLGQWHWEAGEYFAKNPEATRPTEARDDG
jgi:hypothetical protein